LWQAGDNTKRWLTLEGILGRLDEWAEHAADGFTSLDGAALDPHLYFERYDSRRVGIHAEGLVRGIAQDGQHDIVHLDFGGDDMPIIAPGMAKGSGLWGRWFYRSSIPAPPKSLADFEAALTDNQRARLNKIVTTVGQGLFVLIWPTPHGLSSLALYVTESDGKPRAASALMLTPSSQADRLRRAGPDAETLALKRVVLFGVGAIGSHLGSLLVRSGLGHLTLVDSDVMVPVVLVRHAASTVGATKVDAFQALVAGFEWATVQTIARITWLPDELAELISGADLCIDATGSGLFAELLSRVAAAENVPMVSAALYRGGRVARVRRQAPGDHPIVYRTGDWRYPLIPIGADRAADFVGTETGCTAPIHNAPPTSVMAAAALGSAVAIDLMTARFDQPDEIIEVLEPIEAPFHRLGRSTPEPPTVMLTDDARSTMVAAAAAVHPAETGGIRIGLIDSTGAPCIVKAVEFRPTEPSRASYVVPEGETTEAIDSARTTDGRLGYVGEWHSHPTDQPASLTDGTTMARLADNADTGIPVLCVLRPMNADVFNIDAYLPIRGDLHPAPLVGVGPVPAEGQP
jgi:hypothetical protein